MIGRTDFAQLRTIEIAARMGARFNPTHRGAQNVSMHALEIRRMERELEALQTTIDADPSRLGECGPAMRLLHERLVDAYTELYQQTPFEHTREDAEAQIYRHRQNHRPLPMEPGRFWTALTLAAVVAVCVALLMQATGTLTP